MAVFQNTNSNITTTVANGTGSLSLVGNLWTSANAYISGDLTVDGNVTYINITSLNVQDPIISLGRGPNDTPLTANDGKDRGENMWYYTTAEHSAFIGFQNATGCLIAASNVVIANEIVTVNNWGTFRMGNVIADQITGNLANIVGNINAGNFRTVGLITATGNITGGNIDTAGLITAAGNITTGANVNVAGLITAGGNITSNANVNVAGLITAGGNITSNANINVAGLITAGGNITSNANVNVAGLITAGGNITSNANINVAGLITAGGNITSNANINVAGLITAAGNINTASNVNVAGLISATGNIIGGNLITSGSANVGAITISGNLNSGNLFTSGIVSATGNITTSANLNVAGLITAGGNITSNANISAAGIITATGNVIGGNILTDGAVVTPIINPLPTAFTGTIAGNVLTVTSGIDGTIAANQYVQGAGVLDDTLIEMQLTQTSANAGGNGTYLVTNTQNIGPITMWTTSLYISGDIKLTEGRGIFVQDEHDPYLFDNLVGIYEDDATIHIGSFNTNGLTLDNGKEYKINSNLNPGAHTSVASMDGTDNVTLSSGNANTTQIRVGGDTSVTGFAYAQKFFNGGEAHIPKGLRIGDNVNSTAYGAALEVTTNAYSGGSFVSYKDSAGDPYGSFVYGARYHGTLNAPQPVQQNDWIMEFGAGAWDGTGLGGGGELAWRVDGAVSPGVNPSRAEIYVTPQGTAAQTLGLTIDSYLTVSAYGNVVTPANVSATANVIGGNVLTNGVVSAGGNVRGGNINTAGLVTATGNVIGGNILTSGLISATGNVTAGNVNTSTVRNSAGALTISTGSGNINLTSAANVVVNNTTINGLADPQQNQDAATKYYVDNAVSTQISYHTSVLAATIANLATTTGGTITYAQPNGAGNGVGATITTTGSFNLIDTANVQTVGTRILVKDEGNAVFNGVYTWSNATVITRSTDADTYGTVPNTLSLNDYFFVQNGNVNAGASYVVNSPTGTITFGTSNITFAEFSKAQVYSTNVSAGLSLTGTVFSAKVDNITTAFDGSGNIVVKTSANLTTPNIGAATGTSVSVTGNILTGGVISATGNITTSGTFVGAFFGTITGNLTVPGSNTQVLFNNSGNAGATSGFTFNSTSNAAVVTGNVTGGNLLTSGLISAASHIGSVVSVSANITGGNILTGGLISATGNITGSSLLGTVVSASANVTGGNILTGGLISATGTLTGSSLLGSVVSASANVTGGNILTGGLISATGNITGGNVSVTGNVNGNVNGFAIGYLNIPQVSFGANTTTAASDAGKHYYSTSAANLSLTIANNSSVSWAVGTTITIINQGTGTITIGQGSGVSMYFAGNSTAANRSLSTFGMATIINVASNTWFINGSGVY